ncbi:MAG: hypothetical protein Phog2KO_47920 [Phototrophicaceae bacterium]
MSAIYMDVDRMSQIADRFRDFAEILNTIDTVLEIAVNTLRTTAFIGLVGGIGFEYYVSNTRPKILNLADYCEEMANDLDKAVQHFINGDAMGASRFY